MPATFFDKEILRLRESLAQMGGAVEHMLDTALTALESGDLELAEKTVKMDKAINEYDTRLSNKAILLIATNQPVATDLRFLAASLKIVGELERIGDLSVNVARRVKGMMKAELKERLPDGLGELVILAQSMFSDALSAFVNRNIEQARDILARDDLVDELNREIYREMVERIAQNGPLIHWGLEIIQLAAHLERLADHATNLAEEVIYIYSGRNVRHSAPASSLLSTLSDGNRTNREDLED